MFILLSYICIYTYIDKDIYIYIHIYVYIYIYIYTSRGLNIFDTIELFYRAPPLGRKVTTADADHCRTLKAIGSAEDSCCALNRLQWVRNGLTLTTADDYNSEVGR